VNQSNAPPDNVPNEVVGYVAKVEGSRDKPYAVTKTDAYEGSVTFSLSVWQGEDPPQPGQVVLLGRVIETGMGFRAGSARPKPIPIKRNKWKDRKEQR